MLVLFSELEKSILEISANQIVFLLSELKSDE